MVEPTKDKQPESKVADIKRPDAEVADMKRPDDAQKANFAANEPAAEPEAAEDAE